MLLFLFTCLCLWHRFLLFATSYFLCFIIMIWWTYWKYMCGLSVFVPFSFFKFHKILSIQSADIILAYSTFILSITLEHLIEVYFTGPSHWVNCLQCLFFFFNSLWCMIDRKDQLFSFLVNSYPFQDYFTLFTITCSFLCGQRTASTISVSKYCGHSYQFLHCALRAFRMETNRMLTPDSQNAYQSIP